MIIDKKGKLLGVISIIDILIVILVAGVGYFGYTKILTPGGGSTAAKEMTFKVEILNCPTTIEEMLIEGGAVRESVKGNKLGTLVGYTVSQATTVAVNTKDGTFVTTDIPDRCDVVLELKTPYAVKNANILVDGLAIKIGAKTYIQGKGFAGIGYIIDIPVVD